MVDSDSCRLCFSTENYHHMDIFSDIGNDLKMREIISEHFKCEISEIDSLPNTVCDTCWQTTEAFHKLYQNAKAAQAKFLNPLIKIELDTNELWSENSERETFIDETQIDAIKLESNTEFADVLDTSIYEDEISDKDSSSQDIKDVKISVKKSKIVANSKITIYSRRKTAKQKNIDFKKLFAENVHRFDLSCDLCSHTLKTLDDARIHYANVHENPKGYIKCCNTKLSYRCEIVQHLYRHIDPDKYKCNECGKLYISKHGLSSHLKQHNAAPEKQCLICDICKKSFTSKVGLKKHLKWHMEVSKSEGSQYDKFIKENFDMTCDNCEAVFISFHDARRHYKEFHNDKKGYIKCCKIKLRELWIVTDHINSHMNPTNFKCDSCNKVFSSGIRLKQHQGRHRRATERPFICDICGKSFRDKETITRHLFINHVDTEPKYECEICHKRFQLPALLKNHCYSVHREKKAIVTCEICGKSFSVKANFEKHMLSHTNKRERLAQRKQCDHCGEWLMTKSGIYYHEQIHKSGVQKCNQCEMELPNKIALLYHIRKHHRERNYKCSYCDKSFPVSSELKKHEEGHTRHNVYPCQFCNKLFTLRTSRLTHQKRSHREELKHLRETRKLMKHSTTTIE